VAGHDARPADGAGGPAVGDGRGEPGTRVPLPARAHHPDELRAVVGAGVRQHQLITAERELLEATLRGAVQALLDVLSVAHPPAFARATRVRQLVCQLAATLDAPDAWQLEVAAVLSQLGAVSLPVESLERLNTGQDLDLRDRAMLARVPMVTERLLTEIPRLEPVRAAIRCQRLRYDGDNASPRSPRGADIPLGARLLRLALDADALTSRGMRRDTVHRELAKDAGAYDPDLLDLLGPVLADGPTASRPVRVEDLRPGMVVAEDVLNDRGALLIGRGSEITAALVERLRNHAAASGLGGPLLVEQ
jgi:HD-GYP domain-containing protein (c-di-GMP phosphodiesterase class II)